MPGWRSVTIGLTKTFRDNAGTNYGFFASLSVRPLALSRPGSFAPGLFAPWLIRPLVFLPPGLFAPWLVHFVADSPLALSPHGLFAPCAWLIGPLGRTSQGKNWQRGEKARHRWDNLREVISGDGLLGIQMQYKRTTWDGARHVVRHEYISEKITTHVRSMRVCSKLTCFFFHKLLNESSTTTSKTMSTTKNIHFLNLTWPSFDYSRRINVMCIVW